MLKTQFAKAFYLCNAFLLITTSITVSPLSARSIHESRLPVKETESASDKPEIRLNKKGALFVKKYIKNSKECLVRVKKRSIVPFSIIDSVLNIYHLPLELKYLAVIESELKPSALSHVGARGPWQLMPATAQVLGLKTSHQNDERTNYYKSTIAAAKYLRDLYAQFNDWLLVLAAYNGGPRPVYNAIQKSGSRNFWVLQNYLPAESRDHVKKFIATHYYFEGRGSETTLTRAENMEFKKMVKEFVKSNRGPKMHETINPNPFTVEETQAIHFDMNQLIGFKIDSKRNNPQNKMTTTHQPETSEEKFKRLMRESEESLNRAKKII
ncbi:MAG TPA: lytic transglycosylase domain-containing protein [Puia sp.]|nr:lytic transglycosylase domain-containing protein [Puia sp.]